LIYSPLVNGKALMSEANNGAGGLMMFEM